MTAPPVPALSGAHHALEPRATEAARRVIAAEMEFGPVEGIEPEEMPDTDLADACKTCRDAWEAGRQGFTEVQGFLLDRELPEAVQDRIRATLAHISGQYQSAERPEVLDGAVGIIRAYQHAKAIQLAKWQLRAAIDAGEDIGPHIARIAALETQAADGKPEMVVYGVNSYPTDIPPELVLLGNGWGRIGDILTFISTAGAGKSVAVTQAAMAWGLGLPYLGIHPARPLRILLFSGEDDGVTIGQCREGFLEHSEAITGRQLSPEDLEPLDGMLRTDFSREHAGLSFHTHLAASLRWEPADLVIVNPLLSFIGGEIVACSSEWLRVGLMPTLQKHNCMALIAHHTGKMARDGWDNTDDTYSAIGGGEMANVPRAILTLRPTPADGLSVVKVAKRPTTGWKDANGSFTTSYFVKRSGDPERPAWIPVASDEAQELIDAGKAAGTAGSGGKKATSAHVMKALETGAMQRQALIDWIMRECRCTDRPARNAIRDAEANEFISSFTQPNPHGGNPLKWLCLPEHKNQWVA